MIGLLLHFLMAVQSAPEVRIVTVPHQATLYFQSSACTSHKPCALQVWRATCPTVSSCPSWSAGSNLWTRISSGTGSATPTQSGTKWVVYDSDPVLQDHTTYAYCATASYYESTETISKCSTVWVGTTGPTPPSKTPLAPTTGAGNTVAAAATTVNFNVQLDFDNSTCVNGSNCNAAVYRAICTTGTGPNGISCPSYGASPASFIPVTGTLAQTVTTSNTHFKFVDNDTSQYQLQYNVGYDYAVMNAFQANSAQWSTPAEVQVKTPSGVHSATVNWSNPACRTSSPCNLQVYRAICSSATSCPAYPGAVWKALDMSNTNLVPTVGAQATTWVYTDHDTALVGSTTYMWVATNTYTGGASASLASTGYVGTTAVGRQAAKVKAVEVKESK